MKPAISVVVPFHWMENWQFFLTRCLESTEKQTFKDYEVILTKAGSMPVNTNRAIKCAEGEIVKVLYMDDWLESENYLEEIYSWFKNPDAQWLITAALNNPEPVWTDDIHTGNNRLGSPSALSFRNHFEENELFDEHLSWLLDVDLYRRLKDRFGKPMILKNVTIGIGEHPSQMTHILTDDDKRGELLYVMNKHG